jgi:hypothetical protein
MLKNKAFSEFLLAFGLLLMSCVLFYLQARFDMPLPGFLPWVSFVISGISFVYGVSCIILGIRQLISQRGIKIYSTLAIAGGGVVTTVFIIAVYIITHLD